MKLDKCQVAVAVMDTRFMMASMGQVVGEKITRLFVKATKENYLLCCFAVLVGR